MVGTHGRGAFVLDDIRPLRQISEQIQEEPVHIFPIPPAQQYRVRQTGASRFPGHGEFRGANRPYGALLTYSLNIDGLPDPEEFEKRQSREKPKINPAAPPGNAPDDEEDTPKVEIRITDANGEKIRVIRQPAHQGVNRAVWDLRRDAFQEPPGGRAWWRQEPRGPEVSPGEYQIQVRHEAGVSTATVEVLADPRLEIDERARQANWDALLRAGEAFETVAAAIERIEETRRDLDRTTAKTGSLLGDANDDAGTEDNRDRLAKLQETAGNLKSQLGELEKKFRTPPNTKGIPPRNDVLSKIRYVRGSLESTWEAPTRAQLQYLRQAEQLLEKVLIDFNRFFAKEIPPFRKQIMDLGIELFPERESLQL